MVEEASGEKWFTVVEIANRLSLSKMTVYRMISDKEITAYKFGRSFRIKEADLESYIRDSLI